MRQAGAHEKHVFLFPVERWMPFALLATWLGIVVLVGTGGNFPQNDDFAYAKIVSILFERGIFEFGDYVATNLLSNVLWGSLFVWLFGDNFESLRISTLVAAAGGLTAMYAATRQMSTSTATASLLILSATISPLFLWHAFGFMSDVPFMAAEAASVCFLLRGLDKGRRWDLVLGWGFGLMALLSRQTALAIPLAYGFAILLPGPVRLRSLITAIVPLLIFLVAQSIFERWLIATDNVSTSFGRQMAQIPELLAQPGQMLERCGLFAWRAYLYLGLFFLPASLWVAARWLRSEPAARALALGGGFVALSALTSALAIARGDRMPIWWNTWNAGGFDIGAYGIPMPDAMRLILTLASCVGGALLTGLLIRAIWLTVANRSHPLPMRRMAWFAWAGFAVSSAAIILAEPGWDRYLIGLFPWLVVIVAMTDTLRPDPSAVARWGSAAAASVVLAVLAAYSVAELYNATVQRRVMLALVDSLVAAGIDRDDINAGWVLDSAGTSRIADYGNRLSGNVPYFVRPEGTLTGDWDMIAVASVRRIMLWNAPSPAEAIYRRR